MAYNYAVWSMSGFNTQAEAEKKLTEMIDWTRSLPNYDKWTVNASVTNGAYGWKASVECDLDA